jgi:ArsR family transcriptional regulator
MPRLRTHNHLSRGVRRNWPSQCPGPEPVGGQIRIAFIGRSVDGWRADWSHHAVLISQSSLINASAVRALADPLRARIVELLASEQLCTCHLVELTGGRQTNISNHLRVLREVGLVEAEVAGRYTYYRLIPDRLEDLAGQFAELASRARLAVSVKRPCG